MINKLFCIATACVLPFISSASYASNRYFFEKKGVPECYIEYTNKNRDYLTQVFAPYDHQKSEACIIEKANQFAHECNNNNSDSCYRYGLIIEPDDYSRSFQTLYPQYSFPKAYNSFKRACDLGNVRGCYKTGYYLLEGLGTRKNDDMGINLLEQACNRSISQACMALGQHYLSESVGVNAISEMYYMKKAVQFYGKACDYGNEEGCRQYAIYK